jgi:hypothetical protein
MFNPFNFGARPTPSRAKVFVLRTIAHAATRMRIAMWHSPIHHSPCGVWRQGANPANSLEAQHHCGCHCLGRFARAAYSGSHP